MRKLAVSLADSIDLRIILSVLYIITEVMREELRDIKHSEYKENVESFKEDLGMLCLCRTFYEYYINKYYVIE